MALLGLGEDIGGSIRIPSSFCGLIDLRATLGMISRQGLSPLVITQDTSGLMCRTVTDAALVFDAMVGYDEADPYTATALLAGRPKGGSYAANPSSETMRHTRLGVHWVQMLGADSDPDCATINIVVNRTLETLKSSGTHLMDIEIPDMERACSSPRYIVHALAPTLTTSCHNDHISHQILSHKSRLQGCITRVLTLSTRS